MSNQIEDFYKSMQQSFSSTPTLMHPALRAQAHAREQDHARAEYTEETKHRVAESRKRYLTEQKEKIASEPTKRWVIKFGRVFAEGAFVSKPSYVSN